MFMIFCGWLSCGAPLKSTFPVPDLFDPPSSVETPQKAKPKKTKPKPVPKIEEDEEDICIGPDCEWTTEYEIV